MNRRALRIKILSQNMVHHPEASTVPVNISRRAAKKDNSPNPYRGCAGPAARLRHVFRPSQAGLALTRRRPAVRTAPKVFSATAFFNQLQPGQIYAHRGHENFLDAPAAWRFCALEHPRPSLFTEHVLASFEWAMTCADAWPWACRCPQVHVGVGDQFGKFAIDFLPAARRVSAAC